MWSCIQGIWRPLSEEDYYIALSVLVPCNPKRYEGLIFARIESPEQRPAEEPFGYIDPDEIDRIERMGQIGGALWPEK